MPYFFCSLISGHARMQAIASDKRKLAALFAVITLEVIAAIVLLKIGGFQFIRHWLMKLK